MLILKYKRYHQKKSDYLHFVCKWDIGPAPQLLNGNSLKVQRDWPKALSENGEAMGDVFSSMLEIELTRLPLDFPPPRGLRGFRWILTCFERWSERVNFLPQIVHPNGLTPVCFRSWRASSSDLENRQSQPGQVQAKGLSPVCLRRWALRWELLE